MSDIFPLKLGSLGSDDTSINRSGLRWLRSSGMTFRKGDPIAYCSIALRGAPQGLGDLFDDFVDRRDLQVALIATVDGRLRDRPDNDDGGWHDSIVLHRWNPEEVIAGVELLSGPPADGLPALNHQILTGRRACEMAEDHSGMLTGWHDRARAWREIDDGPWGSVLGLGICELGPVLRGDGGAFVEFISACPGNVHVVNVPDVPLVHNAKLIVEQLRRTPEEGEMLAELFAEIVSHNPAQATPADWSFAAMALQGLRRSPVSEEYDLLTSRGVIETGPSDAVILSINAELPFRLVHRKHGFSLDCHGFRLATIGPALRSWFQRHFEWQPYSLDDVRKDYVELARRLRAVRPNRQILVLNAMSTFVGEEILSYETFDTPLSAQLRGVRARELNGLLHDLAREIDIAIVDSDAIGAELGAAIAIPDGTHQNGEMQAELRAEIRAILAGRNVPGFA